MGPCHAEEIAAEKLSYLTFSGIHVTPTQEIASNFSTDYLNTITNNDIYGVQYAAVLKNIYALGAGIAHGLEYGDNFLSVFIANCADEMAGFLQKAGIRHIEVGIHENSSGEPVKKSANYAASVYLGDLLVTCYSLFSRNRTFGNMIGKDILLMRQNSNSIWSPRVIMEAIVFTGSTSILRPTCRLPKRFTGSCGKMLMSGKALNEWNLIGLIFKKKTMMPLSFQSFGFTGILIMVAVLSLLGTILPQKTTPPLIPSANNFPFRVRINFSFSFFISSAAIYLAAFFSS